MRRFFAASLSIAAISIFELSCNSIVGIDGIEGAECEVTTDCQALGECIRTACNDGLCQHTLSIIRSTCDTGLCDGKGHCVECVDADDCEDDPFFPLCAEDGRCVECLVQTDCQNPTRPICADNVCVQCVTEAECELLPDPCLESRCAEGLCLIVTKGVGEVCMGGKCDGKGVCVPD